MMKLINWQIVSSKQNVIACFFACIFFTTASSCVWSLDHKAEACWWCWEAGRPVWRCYKHSGLGVLDNCLPQADGARLNPRAFARTCFSKSLTSSSFLYWLRTVQESFSLTLMINKKPKWFKLNWNYDEAEGHTIITRSTCDLRKFPHCWHYWFSFLFCFYGTLQSSQERKWEWCADGSSGQSCLRMWHLLRTGHIGQTPWAFDRMGALMLYKCPKNGCALHFSWSQSKLDEQKASVQASQIKQNRSGKIESVLIVSCVGRRMKIYLRMREETLQA
jgi:hypothetical protein